VTCVRGDVGDHKADEDGAAIQRFLIVEFAAAIAELSDSGLAENAAADVGEVKAPLAGLRIVEAQAERFDMAGGTVDLKFDEIGAAIPNFSDDRGAVVLDPGC
jgi:hypothetical protein